MKLLALMWTILYFTLTSGISFGLHFCKGNIAEITVFKTHAAGCGMQVTESAEANSSCHSANLENDLSSVCSAQSSCCNDVEVKIYSPDQLLKSENEKVDFSKKFNAPQIFAEAWVQPEILKNFLKSNKSNAPPETGSLLFLAIPKYILHCNLKVFA